MTIERVAGDPRFAQPDPLEEIRRFFRSSGKHVISFAGFGELGYQDAGIVERTARSVLADCNPEDVIVNCGTLLRSDGQDGIAGVFSVACEMSFLTTGIHPGVALTFAETHRISPYERHPFFVDDSTWGGYLDDERRQSPTLQTILEVTEELVVVGGGRHAADELDAFLRAGKKVRYIDAEMNRRTTSEWCERAGVRIDDLRGAAHTVWQFWNGMSPTG